ncbi:LuxR C-terminal-related transcriptional regulator [Alkalihalobacillus sp. BA299]|uniref:helix-turn-helix domain-containing protein n=1 Tax=Alkalihalobacillus sp. BA299 TaxID=2815938 RepID=UPI001AD9B123|nr:LuxR C-terminal-related transcriptional regulator [Alkalihalobacillus sp. BA299]
MVNELTINEYICNIDKAVNTDEKLRLITIGLIDLFPIEEVHLFRYSPLGHIVEGIIKINPSGLDYIGHVRDHLTNLPPIEDAIRTRKAVFVSGEKHFEFYGSKYSNPNGKNDHFIVPITFSSNVVGYFGCREFNKNINCGDHYLSSLTHYGKMCGKLLQSNKDGQSIGSLSKRETEVLQRISWGESITEMANSMEISEYTVKDYIKSAIKKLEAKNRVEAVAELLRKGLIS